MRPIQRVNEKAARLRVPLTVHFDLTYRCHQGCLHCYIPQSWRQGAGPGPELDTEEVQDVLDQLATAGAFFLTFSGGEIFLRPDILTILEHARKLNFSCALMTSGTLGLDEEKVHFLAELGIEQFLFSLYSLEPAIHDRVTGKAGSLAELLKTVERCRRRGIPVGFNVFGLSLNQQGIEAIADYVRKEGFFMRYDGTISPRWDGSSHPGNLSLDPESTLRLEEAVGSFVAEPFPELCESKAKKCFAGSSGAYITPVGDIRPCMDISWTCGNLRREKFSRIWEDSPVLVWVREFLDQSLPGMEKPCDVFMHHEKPL